MSEQWWITQLLRMATFVPSAWSKKRNKRAGSLLAEKMHESGKGEIRATGQYSTGQPSSLTN
jgi:hypothetical protein